MGSSVFVVSYKAFLGDYALICIRMFICIYLGLIDLCHTYAVLMPPRYSCKGLLYDISSAMHNILHTQS
jgi:hypothetical protein